MLLRTPDYFPQFRCLAGSCPCSCCIGWEVEIDDDTAAGYAAVPGPLGDELRSSLQADAEGVLCFPLQGARCPFLDNENLCRIHRQLGQEHTSITCREHPRFTEDFGPLQEISLSASCPEAARLLLAETQSLGFAEEWLPDPGEEGDPWLSPLLAVRDAAFALLQDRSVPLGQRMTRVLTLALHGQTLLDSDQAEDLPALCRSIPEPPAIPAEVPALFPALLDTLSKLEILEQDWLPLLTAAKSSGGRLPEPALERITAYFLFRWVLKAVNNGDLLGYVQLSLASALTVERLSAHTASPEEALYRYCREIEHCEENIAALLDAFCRQELSPPALLRRLQTP